MNCKPGDLALIVRSEVPSNVGKIVRCVRFIGAISPWRGNDRWLIEGSMQLDVLGNTIDHQRDSYMRPLRDNDGEDEILRIVGKPETVVA